jgi:Protein of unknown function (DUF2865)
MRFKRPQQTLRHSAILMAAVGVLTVAPAGAASAGLLDFLFGYRRPPPPPPAVVIPPMPALGNPFDRSSRQEIPVERGPSVAYCVRLCDGHPFPVQSRGLSPAQACRAVCPASPTAIFAGGSIANAVSPSGKRYSELPNAFLYRKRLVAGCTCNGRTPGGLAAVDVQSDPTLHRGDVVVTHSGLVAVTGASRRSADFTPVESYTGISAKMRRELSQIEIAPTPVSAQAAAAQASVPPDDSAAADDGPHAQLSR